MRAWQIPEWAIGTALCGVLVLGAVDLYLMRRHPVTPHPRAQAEVIGLHAEADGDSLHIQWNRHARPIVNADRAVLHIADGEQRRHVVLSGAQLDNSSVRYWPEREHVSFRMEVFRGEQQASDATDSTFAPARQAKQAGLATVEKLRPSPFEQAQPEIVVLQYRQRAVVRLPEVAEADVPPQQLEEKSSFDRVLSKIPLLRRLRKHEEFDQNQTPRIPR